MKYQEVVPLVNEILDQYTFALTVRQIYYRLISDPYLLFENTRSNYNGFDRILTKAREEEEIDWTRIEDRTRQSIGGEEKIADETPEDFLQAYIYTLKSCWQYYDKKMWTSQKKFLEVWVEKDALSSLVSQACRKYRILTFPSRGYSSFTKIKEGIDRLSYLEDKEQICILHLADHDPSGLGMTQDLKNRFAKYDADFIEVERIALNIEQVREFDLRPNPVKRADSRAAEYVQAFGTECWELDALPPDELQKIIVAEIETYIDLDAWKDTEEEIEEGKLEIRGKLTKIIGVIDKNK